MLPPPPSTKVDEEDGRGEDDDDTMNERPARSRSEEETTTTPSPLKPSNHATTNGSKENREEEATAPSEDDGSHNHEETRKSALVTNSDSRKRLTHAKRTTFEDSVDGPKTAERPAHDLRRVFMTSSLNEMIPTSLRRLPLTWSQQQQRRRPVKFRQNETSEVDYLGRTKRMRLCTCSRPHYLGFHFAWLSFFVAFMGWFTFGAISPDVVASKVATSNEVIASNAMNLTGTILVRFLLGPICEAYGPRRVQASILLFGGVCVGLLASVTNGAGLIVVRFFIGFVGGAFVPCQFWVIMMMAPNISGTMSGLAAGVGNSGAGFIIFIMGGLLDGFTQEGYSVDVRWRLSLIVPALLMILTGLLTWRIPDDVPQGSYEKRLYNTNADRLSRMLWARRLGRGARGMLEREQRIERVSNGAMRAFLRVRQRISTDRRVAAFLDWRAWVLGLQYAVASGVELSILSTLPTFYYEEFQGRLSLGEASMVASIFGICNLWGRALGGLISDVGAFRWGARGRHLAVLFSLMAEGGSMVGWASVEEPVASAIVLVIFATMVHIAKGTVSALIPFVNPAGVGPVTGVVSAVGQLGGILMSIQYAYYTSSRDVYIAQGYICLGFSVLAFCLPAMDLSTGAFVYLVHPPWLPVPEEKDLFEDEEVEDEMEDDERLSKNEEEEGGNGDDDDERVQNHNAVRPVLSLDTVLEGNDAPDVPLTARPKLTRTGVENPTPRMRPGMPTSANARRSQRHLLHFSEVTEGADGLAEGETSPTPRRALRQRRDSLAANEANWMGLFGGMWTSGRFNIQSPSAEAAERVNVSRLRPQETVVVTREAPRNGEDASQNQQPLQEQPPQQEQQQQQIDIV